jgi:ubiquinone/menaquinone biosynthesis C-methylase UbiE
MDPEIVAHYQQGDERDRLAGWSLERLRSEELLARLLPPPPARVLDVGGGPGRYAAWLSDRGYSATLLDPVPLHVEQAREVRAHVVEQGDGRRLPHRDGEFDAVLVMGPLYHLVERADRIAVLEEARRVVRPGGVVAAAAISRTASLLDGFDKGQIRDQRFRAIVEQDLATGTHTNPGQEGWFTTAYFHGAAELRDEMTTAGLDDVGIVGIEGPAWLWGDRGREPDDEDWRAAALWAARAVEHDADFIPMSAHLLASGRA